VSWKLDIRVVPNARKAGIELVESGLRIKLTVPAVEGKANRALIEFLSGILGVRKSGITIVKGEKSRTKTVVIDTPEPFESLAALVARVQQKN